MAATVINGLTNVTLANDNTGFSVWKRDGTGGTPSAISETDVFLQGTGACSVKVSNQGVVLAYGASLDLSATDTHVYIWANMLAGPLMKPVGNTALPGLGIFIGYDASISGSNYDIWAVDGADTYPGGWVRYVLDVSKTPTISSGTAALASVDWIGMYCNTQPNVAKFDNLVIDRIDYTTGAGLRVYGTSTTDDTFGDILAEDEGTIANKYGIVTSKEGIIYVRGSIELGDDTGTNACNLTDVDKVIVMEDPKFVHGTPLETGTVTTADATGVTLTDTAATFQTNGVEVGDVVYNSTDGGAGIVTSITSETVLVCAAGLAGGTNDDFGSGDSYEVSSYEAATSSAIWNLNVVGNGTGSTTVQWGKKVGSGDTAQGRNGLTIIGNGAKTSMDFDDGNANSVLIYGSSIRNVQGTLSWGTNSAHELIGCTIDQCSQFDPVGGIVQRNNTYSGHTTDNSGALLWNSSIDIKNCNFLANTDATNDPSGIEHATVTILESGTITTADAPGTTLIDSAATFITNGVAADDSVTNITDGSTARVVSIDSETQLTTTALTGGSGNDYGSSDSYSVGDQETYDNLQFSGNDFDVYCSDAQDSLTVSKTNGANPASYDTAGQVVNFIGSVTVQITIVTAGGTGISGVQVSVYLSSDNSEVINTTTNGSGVASGAFSGSTPANCYIRWRKSSTGSTRYFSGSATGVIASGTGITAQYIMQVDNIAAA